MNFNTLASLIILTFLQFHVLISGAGNADIYGYTGCYNISNLQHYPRVPGLFDIEVCRTACYRTSYSYDYVFIRNSSCYCTDQIMGNKLPESDCNIPCPWNISQICGGPLAVSLFTSRLNHTVMYVVTPTPDKYYSQFIPSYRRIDVTWMYERFTTMKDSLVTIDFFNVKDKTKPAWTIQPPFSFGAAYSLSGYPYYSSHDEFNLPNATEAFLPVGYYVAKVTRKDDSMSAWSQQFVIVDFPTLLTPLNGTVINASTPLEISWKSNFPELPMSMFCTYYHCSYGGRGGRKCISTTVEAASNLPTGVDGIGSYTWITNSTALKVTIHIGYTDYNVLSAGFVVIELIQPPPNTNTGPLDETVSNGLLNETVSNAIKITTAYLAIIILIFVFIM